MRIAEPIGKSRDITIATTPKPMNSTPAQKSSGFLIFSCTIIYLLFKTRRNCRALATLLG
jgi:hypothetical protein